MQPTPAQILNLTGPGAIWKLTLPVGSPDEILQADLGGYSDPKWFRATPDAGVAFQAPVNGATTSGSGYPRSELREMNLDGSRASWSAQDGKAHTMTIVEAFTHLPNDKPHCVGGQIHDSANDWCVFRLEGRSLYMTNGNDPHYKLITDSYVLGTKFEAKFVVYGGKIQAFYNGSLIGSIDASKLSGAYFKAGCYTQANCGNSSPCADGNYGEVTIYSLSVVHGAKPGPTPVPQPPTPAPSPTPSPAPQPAPAPSPAPSPAPGLPPNTDVASLLKSLRQLVTETDAWLRSYGM